VVQRRAFYTVEFMVWGWALKVGERLKMCFYTGGFLPVGLDGSGFLLPGTICAPGPDGAGLLY